jgi:hypothetical protein
MSATPAAGLSIWLLPEAAQASLLDAIIMALSPHFLTPPFTAHVTLQGDLTLNESAGRALARSLSATRPALELALAGIGSSEAFFRSLYLPLQADAGFDALQAHCARLSATSAGLSPFPHLSLAYGDPREGIDRLALAAPHRARLEALGTLRLDRLVLARSAKDIPIADWQILDSFPLA